MSLRWLCRAQASGLLPQWGIELEGSLQHPLFPLADLSGFLPGAGLMATSVSNTTVLGVKPDFWAPYRSARIPTIAGISELYATQYADKQLMRIVLQPWPKGTICVRAMLHHVLPQWVNRESISRVLPFWQWWNMPASKRRYMKRCRGINQWEKKRVDRQLHIESGRNSANTFEPHRDKCCLFVHLLSLSYCICCNYLDTVSSDHVHVAYFLSVVILLCDGWSFSVSFNGFIAV